MSASAIADEAVITVNAGQKRPYPCSFTCDFEGCDKAFSKKDHLKTHKHTHTGEKPFKCDWAGCDFACTKSGNLTKHKRTHTGEKPFACDWAG